MSITRALVLLGLATWFLSAVLAANNPTEYHACVSLISKSSQATIPRSQKLSTLPEAAATSADCRDNASFTK